MEEQDLVEGLRNRDEGCVETFLERYRSLFYHCIGHFESESSAREDLYQDLVIYVLERLDKGSYDAEKGSFGTWLYRVAWCRCVDFKRKQNARRRPQLSTAGEEVPDRADEGPGPVEQAGSDEIGDLVRNALTTLDPQDQQLLQLRFMQGETLGNISTDLSISVEQAKYRLRRATVSLRKVILNQYTLEEAHE